MENPEMFDQPPLRPAPHPRHRPKKEQALSLLPTPLPEVRAVDPDRFGDPLDRLAKVGELFSNHIINDREFEQLKARIIWGADARL